ncbi:DUF3737 family protein [Candidatus Woesearchaeota archaeon]|nr:DUF3737 family protein [Candidatus Woesearchaeota archaeon]
MEQTQQTLEQLAVVKEQEQIVIINEEDSACNEAVNFFLGYFDTLSKKKKFWGNSQINPHYQATLSFLKDYKINPELVQQFNEEVKAKHLSLDSRFYLGLFLSALIQTSYNQGFNNFEFDKINADHFGAYLQGTKNNPIKVKAKIINGEFAFRQTENCSLETATINGDHTLNETKNIALTTQFLHGNVTFAHSQNSTIEILNYNGKSFGWNTIDCTIYSPNQEVLDKIEKQTWPHTKTNTYIQGKKPQWDLKTYSDNQKSHLRRRSLKSLLVRNLLGISGLLTF